jgi:hypothetical protein
VFFQKNKVKFQSGYNTYETARHQMLRKQAKATIATAMESDLYWKKQGGRRNTHAYFNCGR